MANTKDIVVDGVKLGEVRFIMGGWILTMNSPVPTCSLVAYSREDAVEQAIQTANQLCAKAAFEG